jgi:hypothetical protein
MTINAIVTYDGGSRNIKIKSEFRDDCCYLSSSEMRGLLVFSKTLEDALKRLPYIITELMKRNNGIEKCSVEIECVNEIKNSSE